jgi:peptide/nickel transport system permease protein
VWRYIGNRIIALIPVAAGVLLFVSLMTRMVPGDPVDVILGEYASETDKAALRQSLGLDRSFASQFTTYAGNVLQGDLGKSYLYGKPVTAMIKERFPATLRLATWAMITSILLSLPLGIISALKKNKWQDYLAMTTAMLGIALPNFWLGPLLILIFSLYLDLLPVSGNETWQNYILPSITMGTALAASLSRMTRNSMLECLHEDYTRTARAKGCPEWRVIWIHTLRNAALPIVTIIGLQFGVLLTGAIITEKVFDWPGVGSLMLEAIQSRDYPVVQGCVLIFASIYLLVNLVTDIVYSLVDPRISVTKG